VYAVAYRSEHHCEHQSVCFVYSPSEALADDGAGFWSNEDGWTTLEGATQFSAQEALALSLPHSARGDAFWLGQNRAEGVAAYWAACVADYCGEQADSGQRATRETA
jgi:hypothetical protein